MILNLLKINIRLFVLIFIFIVSEFDSHAQMESLSTQYMQSQLLFNPAYAGTHNSLALYTSARHQWIGINGAPRVYQFNIHAPLNKSKVALGASLKHYSAGPVQQDELNFIYGYVIRINSGLLLSLGVNGGVNYFNVSSSDLVLTDVDDPLASFGNVNQVKPVVGSGTFLYSRDFYVGFSVPHILNVKYKNKESSTIYTLINRHYYFTAGYTFDLAKKTYLKSSFLYRFTQGNTNLLDINSEIVIKEKFYTGISYRLNDQIALLAGMRLNKEICFTYSYDLGISSGTEGINTNSHEVSLSFDFTRMIKYNKYRRFLHKKKKQTDEEDSMRSIRYF